jgi:hypothetical protein
MLTVPTQVVVAGADGRKSISAIGDKWMWSPEACVRLQNIARPPASTADESILKSSHPSSGKTRRFRTSSPSEAEL